MLAHKVMTMDRIDHILFRFYIRVPSLARLIGWTTRELLHRKKSTAAESAAAATWQPSQLPRCGPQAEAKARQPSEAMPPAAAAVLSSTTLSEIERSSGLSYSAI